VNKILVLGGAGFIGYHLANSLSKDIHNEIHILDSLTRGVKDILFNELIKKPNIKFYEINLMDRNVLDELGTSYNYIYNLAAIVGVKHVLEKPYNVLTENFLMTYNSIEFAKKQKNLYRYIFSSTSEVNIGSLQYLNLQFPTPEDFPLALTNLANPRTSYMLSKIYGETLCHHSGLDYIIFRPHNVYGPRMGLSHVIPEIMMKISNLSKNSEIEIVNPDHKRSFCYISDAVKMMINLSSNKALNKETLNLGNQNEEIAIKDLVDIIIEIANRKDLIIKYNDIESSGSPKRRVPKMDKLNKYFNYQPEISIREGCEKIFNWYTRYIFSNQTKSAN
tara:strand:+ start:1195 stop:2196 length:1002 start_codon:yes stop_codon:yes gene_type:complete